MPNVVLAEDKEPQFLHIDLEAELELELVNVEGPGGFENEDTTQLRVKNRSAHVRIDKAVLEPSFEIHETVTTTIQFRADEDSASIDRAYMKTRWLDATEELSFRIEVGRNTPHYRPKRRSESYPLLGTAYWKGREFHADGETRLELGPVELNARASAAAKRPLGTDDAAEDKSFNMYVLDDSKLVTGANFSAGGMFGATFYNVTLLGYGVIGELTDNDDTQFLDQNLSGYADLGDRADRTHFFAGGRARYDGHGVHVVAEALYGEDGNLPRLGWYAQGSYNFATLWSDDHWLTAVEPIFRFGQLRIQELPATPAEPESWDREMITFGITAGFTEFMKVKAEYYVLNEVTEGDAGPSVRDNQLVFHLEGTFDARLY